MNASALLSAVARYSILGLGWLYAVGLIIVNAHLASFGIVSLELARSEYILAGLLWAVISVPCPLVGCLLPYLTRRRLHGSWLIVAQIVGASLGLMLTFLFTEILAGPAFPVHGPSLPLREFWKRIGGITGAYALTFAAVKFTAFFADAWRDGVSHRVAQSSAVRPFLLASGGIVLFLLLLLSVTVYTGLLYPQFPKVLGGGQKSQALVILSEPMPVSLGLPTSDDGRVIGPVLLLLETDSKVAIVGISNGAELQTTKYQTKAVSLARDQIAALLYVSPKPPPHKPP